MDKELAAKVYNHLLKNKMGWCFVNGAVVSMGECERILDIDPDPRYIATYRLNETK
jgi:hypothetical protein